MVGSLIAAGAFGLTVGTAAYAVAVFAVNFALSYVVTRMFSDNPEQQQDMGVRQQVPPSAVNAIPIVYGNAYMGGTFVDAVLTTDQKTMYYVLAISSISPNGQFSFDTADMYYGDRLITFDDTDLTKVVSLTDEAENEDTKISGNLYINLYKSTTGGTITSANGASAPSTVMGGSDIAVGQRWTGTRQMNGLGFAIVKLIYNRDADTTQLQPITFKVAHTLNGTGVAKAGDVWYDYMTNAVYGGAVDAAFVNSTSATALNTYGDQNITFTNSSGVPSTQPRYRINGVLDAGQSVLSNVDRIVSACDSWMTYNAALGQWSVVINKAESTAYAFDDNNIIGEIRVSATDITSSINQVEARFPFKENRDQAAFVNIETPVGLLYPNEPVNKYSITYDMVNDSVQAHYLANRLLEQAREDLIVSFSTTYYGIQVDAGDVVSVTNSDYGWSNKLFRVMKVNEASLPDGSLGAKLELSEYNAQVYDDQNITQFTPIPNSNLTSPVYFSALSTPTVTGFPTASVPNISVQIFIPVTGRITFGNLFFTTNATPSPSDWKLLSSFSTSNSQPIGNNFNYTFTNLTIGSGTYYFAYLVGNENGQSVLSAASTAFVWSPISNTGPFVDISGFTAFTKLNTGVITPATATLTAITTNVTSPTYTWTITGATPASGASSSIVITPTAIATSVVATLVVNGSNLASPVTRSVTMAIVNNGNNGNSARICFARVPSNPSPINGTITTSGNSTFPSSGQSLATWGFSATWGATDPNPSSTDSLYQSDGIYDPTTDATIWSTPYISSLKVGNLEAISTNTGNLTVTGTFQSSTAAISGTTMTGSGGVLYSTGNFAFGSSTGNITYNGTNVTMNGAVNMSSLVASNTASAGYLNILNTNNVLQVTRTANTLLPAFYIYDTAPTSVLVPAFTVQDTASGTLQNLVTFNGYANGGITLEVSSNGSSSGAAKFFNNNASKQFWAGAGAYCAYSPSGGGKIYIIDGNGPFTGFHDTLTPINATVEIGDIMVDTQLIYKDGISSTLFEVAPSNQPNQSAAIGIASGIVPVTEGTPAALWVSTTEQTEYGTNSVWSMQSGFDPAVVESTYKVVQVNALGEGQINVCGENGNIAVGDLIVTSSIAGKGMKQADDIIRSYTVAKAREAATFSSPTDIQMIACIYVSG